MFYFYHRGRWGVDQGSTPHQFGTSLRIGAVVGRRGEAFCRGEACRDEPIDVHSTHIAEPTSAVGNVIGMARPVGQPRHARGWCCVAGVTSLRRGPAMMGHAYS